MVFKITGGSSASYGTFNSFKTSLLTAGILHISTTSIDIFIFPTMVDTSIFNQISSFASIGFGSKSCINSGGGGGTSFIGWGGASFACGGGGVGGGGTRALFLLAYVKISFFLNSFFVFSSSWRYPFYVLFNTHTIIFSCKIHIFCYNPKIELGFEIKSLTFE
jgi:hypothetical protein